MPQFERPPGSLPLSPKDAEMNDIRFEAIDRETVEAKDRVSEYQDLPYLQRLPPLAASTQAIHSERQRKFMAPSFPIPLVKYRNSPFIHHLDLEIGCDDRSALRS